jgi:hypothetical protein
VIVSSLLDLIRPRREVAEGLECLSVTALAHGRPMSEHWRTNFGVFSLCPSFCPYVPHDLAGPEVFLSVIHMEVQRVTLCLEFHPFYTAVYSYGGRNKQDSKQQFQQLKIVCAPARKSTGTSEPAWRLRLIGLPSESVLPQAIFSWSSVLSWCSWSLMHTRCKRSHSKVPCPGIY